VAEDKTVGKMALGGSSVASPKTERNPIKVFRYGAAGREATALIAKSRNRPHYALQESLE
jgi:hypothetical protein